MPGLEGKKKRPVEVIKTGSTANWIGKGDHQCLPRQFRRGRSDIRNLKAPAIHPGQKKKRKKHNKKKLEWGKKRDWSLENLYLLKKNEPGSKSPGNYKLWTFGYRRPRPACMQARMTNAGARPNATFQEVLGGKQKGECGPNGFEISWVLGGLATR